MRMCVGCPQGETHANGIRVFYCSAIKNLCPQAPNPPCDRGFTSRSHTLSRRNRRQPAPAYKMNACVHFEIHGMCGYYTIKRFTLYGIIGMCRLRRHAIKFQRAASERRHADGIISALRILYHLRWISTRHNLNRLQYKRSGRAALFAARPLLLCLNEMSEIYSPYASIKRMSIAATSQREAFPRGSSIASPRP